MKNTKDDAQIMTVEEVADFLKLSKITIYKLVKKGQLPGFRVGNSRKPIIDGLTADI